MRLKSYHTATVEAAIRLAYIELGDEAVFLGSRRNDIGGDPNQAYEVTFALMEPGEPTPTAAAMKTVPNGTSPVHGSEPPSNGSTPKPSADEGAFLSWKKLLRHVSSKDKKADGTARSDAPPPLPQGSNGAIRNRNLPHWKDFVPGELREPLNIATETAGGVSGPNSTAKTVLSAYQNGNHNGDGSALAGVQAMSQRTPAAHKVQLFETDEMVDAPASTGMVEQPRQSLEKLSAEIEELKLLFSRQQQTPRESAPAPAAQKTDTQLDALYKGLVENNIESQLAGEIVNQLRPAAEQGADKKRLAALLSKEIRNRFQTDSEFATSIVAVVGPSGSGKTTAAAKLAFRCGLLRRRKVRLLSVDQLRIGAVEPLQAYAELMNAPLEIIDDFDRFARALAATGAEGELILIDTPGYGRRESERARRLAAVFDERGGVDVHLVLDLRTKDDAAPRDRTISSLLAQKTSLHAARRNHHLRHDAQRNRAHRPAAVVRQRRPARPRGHRARR